VLDQAVGKTFLVRGHHAEVGSCDERLRIGALAQPHHAIGDAEFVSLSLQGGTYPLITTNQHQSPWHRQTIPYSAQRSEEIGMTLVRDQVGDHCDDESIIRDI
jgi:hypothetical protein